MIHFELPKNQSSILKVIGVGGGGGNAVNYMHSLGLDGVDFMVCNTDQQALSQSNVPNKIQLGPHLTQGLGAGANPEIGKQAGEESMEEIMKILKVNTRMAFITAGMGGGTGTGAAPVVAKICRELGILTVGIVTTPFTYEGRKRMKQAQEGIDRMREHVDTILIISNDKLRQQFGNLPFTQAFAKADDVLSTAAKCITDVITTSGQVNVDFADVTTVMKNGGVAILGNAEVEGENRAHRAVEEALNSPLLNDNDISGAKWILLNVNSAEGEHEHTLDELDAIQEYVQEQAGDNCDLIMGVGHDPSLGEKISVTVIATGFNHKEVKPGSMPTRKEAQKVVLTLGETAPEDFISTNAGHSAAPNMDNDMSPRLVEQMVFDPKPAFPRSQEETSTTQLSELKPLPLTIQEHSPTERYKMELSEKPAATANTSNLGSSMQLQQEENMRPDRNMPAQPTDATAGSTQTSRKPQLSPEEQEEQDRFEEQKRLLEERAERLRKLSFNINGGDTDEVENIPAYMRRTTPAMDKGGSQDKYYSGYSVGVNENDGQGSIQTINTFLDGKKPD